MAVPTLARLASRSMRIVALPLTPPCKPVASGSSKTVEEHLTYYHFVTPPDTRSSNSWVKWATVKASDLWAGLGKAPEGNWKRRAYLYGEKLVDRLEFEELALKSLDPSLGPRLSDLVPHGKKPKDDPLAAAPVIPLVYPPSACASPLPHLRTLLEKRVPRHRKGFWFWLLVSPLTAPFMIIPIIPNFPFFFCVWRSWSHYQAYKASQYLAGFLQQGAIVPEPSPQLDAVYAQSASEAKRTPEPAAESKPDPDAPPPSGTESSNPPLLLSRDDIPALQAALGVPPDAAAAFSADVLRALEQARLRLQETK